MSNSWKIFRVPSVAAGRSPGSAFGPFAWTVASSSPDAKADGFESQAKSTLDNLARNLAALGSTKGQILTASVYFADFKDTNRFNEMWLEWIGPNPEHWPQRAIFEGSLPPGTLVEIVVTAAREFPD